MTRSALTPRTLILFLVLVLASAPPTLEAQSVEAPSRTAVSAAQTLQRRGVSPPEIAAAMRRDHRQTAGQTAAVLRALRHDATRSGAAVRRAYRTAGDATVRSLLAGGFSQEEAVRGGVGNRVAVADIARGFSAFRISTDETARALADASVPVDRTVEAFRDMQISLQASASAVVGAYPDIRGRVVDTYQRVGYGVPTLLQVIGVLDFSPETVVEEMMNADEDWSYIQEVLEDAFGMEETAVCTLLQEAGYPFEGPSITGYRIPDFRNMGSGWMESETPDGTIGIVDRGRSQTGPLDGQVEIEGSGLDGPCLRVYVRSGGNEREAEIHYAGNSGITAFFDRVSSGSLRVEHAGGDAGRAVKAIGYRVRGPDQLEAGATFEFEDFMARVDLGLGGPGFDLDIGSLHPPDAVRITSSDIAAGGLAFEATGATLRGLPAVRASLKWTVSGMQYYGEALGNLPYYACQDFRIPEHQCASITTACLGQVFSNLSAVGRCSAPDAWSFRYLDGPGWPWAAQNGGADVTVQVALSAVDGRLTAELTQATGVQPVVSPNVLPTPTPTIPPALVYLMTGQGIDGLLVSALGPGERLFDLAQEAGFETVIPGRILEKFEYVQGGSPSEKLVGVWVNPTGRLLLEFEYPAS